MKNKLVPALVFFAASAGAATFEERVEIANAAFDTEHGDAYEKKLRPLMPEIIKKCAAAGKNSNAGAGKFILVADVSADGKISSPAVKPETPISICFAGEFSARILPAPPNELLADGLAPVIVEIFIVP